MAPYKKGGVFAVAGGGLSERAQYWMPGDAQWTMVANPNSAHNNGAAVSLDSGDAIFVAGHAMWSPQTGFVFVRSVEIFKNGAWTNLADLPEGRFNFAMFAKNDNEIYVFGGMRGDIPPEYQTREPVFKYDRLADSWSALAEDMPHFGEYPSCGKASLNGRESVVCMGSLGHTELNRPIDVFDLESEQWTEMAGVTGSPYRVTFGSLVVQMGTKLYKIRGQVGPDTLGDWVAKIDVLDLESKQWVDPIDVDEKHIRPNHLFIIEHGVIMKKA